MTGKRIRANSVSGTLDEQLDSGETSWTQSEFASLPVVSSPDVLVVVIDPAGTGNGPEVVHVTAHTASSTTATIVRGREGTSAVLHAIGAAWVHGPTVADWNQTDDLTVTGALVAEGPVTVPGVWNVKANNGGAGAAGDGTTDDTAAIGRAISAAGTNGTVYFPPGDYLITGANGLTANVAGQTWELHADATLLPENGTGKAITISADDVTILGGAIDGGYTSGDRKGVVKAATAAALTGTWNYANGTAGVGATLTRTTFGALEAVDNVTLTTGDRLLIKNTSGSVTAPRLGVYTVTTLGDGSTACVLTRATDTDTAAELNGAIVTTGWGDTSSTNRRSVFIQTETITTVGTTSQSWVEASGSGIRISAGADRVRVRDVKIKDVAFYGVQAGATNELHLDGVRVENSGFLGIGIDVDSGGGAGAADCQGIRVANCVVDRTGWSYNNVQAGGIKVFGDDADPKLSNMRVRVVDCEIRLPFLDSSDYTGNNECLVVKENLHEAIVSGCVTRGGTMGISCSGATSIAVVGNSCNGASKQHIECAGGPSTTITGNVIDGLADSAIYTGSSTITPQYGVVVWNEQSTGFDGKRAVVSSNTIRNLPNTSDVRGIHVSDNTADADMFTTIIGNNVFVGGGAYGINLNNGVNYVAITGNMISGAQGTKSGRGISVTSSDNVAITGNVIDSFTHAIYLDDAGDGLTEIAIVGNVLASSNTNTTTISGTVVSGDRVRREANVGSATAATDATLTN